MRNIDFYGGRWILVPFPKSNVEMGPVEFSIRLVRVRAAGKLSQEFGLLRYNLFSAIDVEKGLLGSRAPKLFHYGVLLGGKRPKSS